MAWAGRAGSWLLTVALVVLVASTVRWDGRCCHELALEEGDAARGSAAGPRRPGAGGWPAPTGVAAALSSLVASSWMVRALRPWLACIHGGRAQPERGPPDDDALVTPLIPDGAAITRIAFGSCYKPPEAAGEHRAQDRLWQAVGRFRPELWVWLGDNVYADRKRWVAAGDRSAPPSLRARAALGAMALFDAEDGLLPQVYGMLFLRLLGHSSGSPLVEKVWDRSRDPRSLYAAAASVPGYLRLLSRGVGVAGTWDDHDYGVNDAGREFADKAASRALALEFLQEPAGSDRWEKRSGIYASYMFGAAEEGRRLRLILLDTRWSREAMDGGGAMLGEEQWAWLEGLLGGGGADLTLIGSSVQFVGGVDLLMRPHIRTEGWTRFPGERRRMMRLLRKHRVPAIFLSGDVHLGTIAEMSERDACGVPYPVIDFTSSGMTHSALSLMPMSVRILAYALSGIVIPGSLMPPGTTAATDWFVGRNWVRARRPHGDRSVVVRRYADAAPARVHTGLHRGRLGRGAAARDARAPGRPRQPPGPEGGLARRAAVPRGRRGGRRGRAVRGDGRLCARVAAALGRREQDRLPGVPALRLCAHLRRAVARRPGRRPAARRRVGPGASEEVPPRGKDGLSAAVAAWAAVIHPGDATPRRGGQKAPRRSEAAISSSVV